MSHWFRIGVSFLGWQPGPQPKSSRRRLARAAGRKARSLAVLCGLVMAATAAGCRSKGREVGAAELPVPVSHPVQRVVTDYVEFTGRTDAVESVNIVPRVTGYLVKMPFREGSEVKAGDLLFEVDPRPYQAQLDQAKSQVTLNEAELALAKSTLVRYQELDKTTPGAVSKQALDQYRAAVVEAEARLDAQRKSLEVYNLNKEFTRVVSPIDGQVSRYYLTLGNLVNQDQTLLTTVVSLDPIYAYFDMDERTLLQTRKQVAEGKIAAPPNGEIPVFLGLENEDGFPHQGAINFVNNQVNSTTGSITIRGVFANPRLIPEPEASVAAGAKVSSAAVPKASSAAGPKSSRPAVPGASRAAGPKVSRSAAPKVARAAGRAAAPAGPGTRRWFTPGMFVRIRLPIGQPHDALLIIDRAIQSDQGFKYVYVVDAHHVVQSRSITTGALQEDGLRVVEGEIRRDDWVVVGAIQQVRLRMSVTPDPRPMPSLAEPPETAAAAGAQPAPSPAAKPTK